MLAGCVHPRKGAPSFKERGYMQKITPFLWFDHQAEEAANFYTSIFKNSRILNISRYGEGPGRREQ